MTKKKFLLILFFFCISNFILSSLAVATPGNMDPTQNETCASCHDTPVKGQLIAGANYDYWRKSFSGQIFVNNFNDTHSINLWASAKWSGKHNNNCLNCHDNSPGPEIGECGFCHRVSFTSYVKPTDFHSQVNIQKPFYTFKKVINGVVYFDITNKKYKFKDHFDQTKYDINELRVNTDCIYCHQKNKLSSDNPEIANHDITSVHKIDFPDKTCQQCHKDSMIKEHATNGRIDKAGSAINCVTCHTKDNTYNIPNYEAYRFRLSDDLYVYATWKWIDNVPIFFPDYWKYNNRFYAEEYAIPNKEVKSARLSIKLNKTSDFFVEGFYDGAWHEAYQKLDLVPEFTELNPKYMNAKAPKNVVDEQINFAKPASKIRVSFRNNETNTNKRYEFLLFEVKLDQWVFANPDPDITCLTCHPDFTSKHNPEHLAKATQNCANCHGDIKNGNDVTKIHSDCSTCHESTNTTVSNFIQANAGMENSIYDCAECHGSFSGHNEKHFITATSFVDNQQYKCSGCHNQSYAIEHTNRINKDGKNYTCGSCHDKPNIKNIIASTTGNKGQCNNCHTIHPDINDAHYKQYDYDINASCQGCHKIHNTI